MRSTPRAISLIRKPTAGRCAKTTTTSSSFDPTGQAGQRPDPWAQAQALRGVVPMRHFPGLGHPSCTPPTGRASNHNAATFMTCIYHVKQPGIEEGSACNGFLPTRGPGRPIRRSAAQHK